MSTRRSSDPFAALGATTATQLQPDPFRSDQVKNTAGGYVFALDPWKVFERFLILGTESGTFYVGEPKLTKDNANNIAKLVHEDGVRVVETILDVSVNARAYKQGPTLFALAVCSVLGDTPTRQAAAQHLQSIARTGTMLFDYLEYVIIVGKWADRRRVVTREDGSQIEVPVQFPGRAFYRSLKRWYTDRPAAALSLQIAKYQNRGGWNHSRVLRISHPRPSTSAQDHAFAWALDKWEEKAGFDDSMLPTIRAYELLKRTNSPQDAAKIIAEFNAPWEVVPSELLRAPEVWDAMLPNMGLTALLRNLARMSNINLLTPGSDAAKLVASRITDPDQIARARIHPFGIMLAQSTYAVGRGVKGSLTWSPVPSVLKALGEAFYLSYGNVPKTGKTLYFGVDISGSMTNAKLMGTHLSAADASMALVLPTLAAEGDAYIGAFDMGIRPIALEPGMSVAQALKARGPWGGGGTDASLAVEDAINRRLKVDAFVIITDNETWGGNRHVFRALQDYRARSGIHDARLIVIAMTSTGFTIADPIDPYMLDMVGFDASGPAVMAQFISGI